MNNVCQKGHRSKLIHGDKQWTENRPGTNSVSQLETPPKHLGGGATWPWASQMEKVREKEREREMDWREASSRMTIQRNNEWGHKEGGSVLFRGQTRSQRGSGEAWLEAGVTLWGDDANRCPTALPRYFAWSHLKPMIYTWLTSRSPSSWLNRQHFGGLILKACCSDNSY